MVMNGQLPTEAERGTVRFLFITRKLFTLLHFFDNVLCRQPWRLSWKCCPTGNKLRPRLQQRGCSLPRPWMKSTSWTPQAGCSGRRRQRRPSRSSHNDWGESKRRWLIATSASMFPTQFFCLPRCLLASLSNIFQYDTFIFLFPIQHYRVNIFEQLMEIRYTYKDILYINFQSVSFS